MNLDKNCQMISVSTINPSINLTWAGSKVKQVIITVAVELEDQIQENCIADKIIPLETLLGANQAAIHNN